MPGTQKAILDQKSKELTSGGVQRKNIFMEELNEAVARQKMQKMQGELVDTITNEIAAEGSSQDDQEEPKVQELTGASAAAADTSANTKGDGEDSASSYYDSEEESQEEEEKKEEDGDPT